MKSWPLKKLLDQASSLPPLVLDTKAGLGYFAFQAAALGASVIALEPSLPLFQLMQTTKALNRNRKRNFTIHIQQSSVESFMAAAAVQYQQIDVLRIDADKIPCMHNDLLAGKIRYIFLDMTPSRLKDPLKLLFDISRIYKCNIFEDSHASEGALEEKDFVSLLKGIGRGSQTLFLARDMSAGRRLLVRKRELK